MTATAVNRSHYKSNGSEKHAYNSMREAMAQARNIEVKQGEAMTAYQCSICQLWHVGHAGGMGAQVNEKALSTVQKDIGYVVKTVPAIPARSVPGAPTNPFMESAAKLHQISQDIVAKEAEIRRLADLTKALFSQVEDMKLDAQIVLEDMNQAFTSKVGVL